MKRTRRTREEGEKRGGAHEEEENGAEEALLAPEAIDGDCSGLGIEVELVVLRGCAAAVHPNDWAAGVHIDLHRPTVFVTGALKAAQSDRQIR